MINNIPYDKKLHFIAGLVIAVLGSIVVSPLVGLIAAVVAGIAKEIYDYIDYGLFDYKDMLATWLGGVVGAGVLLLICHVFKLTIPLAVNF